jgi:hypothetical protein
LDPIQKALGKYLPYDHFTEMTIKQGKLYIDKKEVRGGIKSN